MDFSIFFTFLKLYGNLFKTNCLISMLWFDELFVFSRNCIEWLTNDRTCEIRVSDVQFY